MKRLMWFVATTGALAILTAFAVVIATEGIGTAALAVLISLAITVITVLVAPKVAGRTRGGLPAAAAILTTLALALYANTGDGGAGGTVGWLVIGPTAFLSAGIYLLARHPEHRSAWLLTGMAAGTLAYSAPLERVIWAVYPSSGIQPWMSVALAIDGIVVMAGLACLILLVGLFPGGTPRDRLERIVARAVWVMPALMILVLMTNEYVLTDGIAYTGLDPVPSPLYVPALGGLSVVTEPLRYATGALVVVGLVLLVRRYRRVAVDERRQIRWVLYASAAGLAIGVAPYLVGMLISPDGLGHTPLAALTIVGLLLVPGSVVVAIDQPGWIDTDAVIRKSFAYGALSIGIFVVYGAVAAGLGVAAGARLPLEAAIVITALLAFLFQPARARLQRVADRWVFGERPTMVEAITGLDDGGAATEDVAARLADVIRRALRLQWASVAIANEAPGVSGDATGEPVLVKAITRDGETLGEIHCGRKVAGSLGRRDVELVSALAAQAALIVTNVRLAGRIVQAQEAERRRIERNIHDGAQQELVALVAKLGLARTRARRRALDEETLVELQADAQAILRDLRDLAQGIHPSVLTDGGLVEAVEDRCSRLPIDVKIVSSPELRHQRFEDDIEGAAYFFVAEGLTNVLKHSRAQAASVDIRRQNGDLELTIGDDGVGFDPLGVSPTGLAGLADRFAALAGAINIDAHPGGGTRLHARLPIDGGHS